MSFKEFKWEIQRYKRESHVDVPVWIDHDEDKNLFVAFLGGLKVVGNPLTGLMTFNWGDGHVATKKFERKAVQAC